MLAYAAGMSGIAQQKCMDTTHTYINTSFCDGIQMSGKTCMPAGNTQTTVPFNLGATEYTCNANFNDICGPFGGKPADGYCTKKSGSLDYCSILLQVNRQQGTCEYGKPCSVDTDCTVAYEPILFCCPEVKILAAYACTGIDSGKFDAGVSLCLAFESALHFNMMLC